MTQRYLPHDRCVQSSINGVLVGLVYGLVAMSFVVIYRLLAIVNLAQGEMLVFGALLMWISRWRP